MTSAGKSDWEVPRRPTEAVRGADRDATRGGTTKRNQTTSGNLLDRAVAILGAEPVAESLGLTSAVLERLASSGKPMSLPQQRMLGLAVLALSEGQPELRRRAVALLGQVRAAADFESGATETHASPPRSNRW